MDSNKSGGASTLRNLISISLALLPLMPAASYASPLLELSVSLGTEQTDNALLEKENELSERQDIVRADLKSSWQGEIVAIDADYKITHRRFDKDSEEDKTTGEGSASLSIAEGEPLHALIKHSRARLVQGKSSTPLLTNTDERDIFLASAGASARLSGVDTITFTPSYTDIRYREASSNDSERLGAQLSWSRRLSPLNTIVISSLYSDIEFDDTFSERDYTYHRSTIGWQSRLRNLSYELQAGYNSNRRDSGEDTENPYYKLSANYQNALHELELNAVNELTDTSIGNSNRNSNSDFSQGINANNEIDEYELTEISLRYDYSGLCRRCDLHIKSGFDSEKHRLLVEDDSKQKSLSVGLSYRLHQWTTLWARVSKRDFTFDNRLDADFEELQASLLLHHQLSRRLGIDIYSNWQDRDNDLAWNDYSEWVVGMKINYKLAGY
jgi:hypothetical protein